MPGEALAHLHSKGAFPGFDVWKWCDQAMKVWVFPRLVSGFYLEWWWINYRINWALLCFTVRNVMVASLIQASIEKLPRRSGRNDGVFLPLEKRRLAQSFEFWWHWIACVQVVCVSTVGTEGDTMWPEAGCRYEFCSSRGSKRNKQALEWRSNPALVVIILKWTSGASIQ